MKTALKDFPFTPLLVRVVITSLWLVGSPFLNKTDGSDIASPLIENVRYLSNFEATSPAVKYKYYTISQQGIKDSGFLLQFGGLLVRLHFAAGFAEFFDLEFAFAFCIHIYLIPFGNVVLVFTDGTN